MKRQLAAVMILALACAYARAHDPISGLVPVSEATHVADQSGSWQDAATWGAEGVPPAGETAKVHVPTGVEVTNNGAASALWIRCDGMYKTATAANTELRVHTWGLNGTGRIEIGTPAAPITGSAKVIFVPGPFLPGDFTKQTLGLNGSGVLVVCGTGKVPFADTAPGYVANVGATTITLDTAPHRWIAGDQLLVSGTDVVLGEDTTNHRYQAEFVTLDSVSGTTITFHPALVYQHKAWRSWLTWRVANLTRNVEFRSLDPTVNANRGHIMLHHSPGCDIRHAAFLNMGRTRKDILVTDPRLDGTGTLIPGSDGNPRARYTLHWHLAGPDAAPAYVEGCVFDGSPGWGLVNHNSNVIVRDCVGLRCYGSAFTTEKGDENGSFENCFGVLNRGLADVVVSTDDDHGFEPNADWGRDGSGFWLQGGNVSVIDCVAANNSGRGFALFNIPINDYPTYFGGSVYSYLRFPVVINDHRQGVVSSGKVSMREFSGNVAYCNNKPGVQVWSSIFERPPAGIVAVFRNTTIWGGIRGAQFHAEYLRPDVLIDGLKVYGDWDQTGGFRPDFLAVSDQHKASILRFFPTSRFRNFETTGTLGQFQIEAP